jgi:Protein of unknown function (DUF3987)/Bifunctional DNA primase/polymerase, N-terminal
VPDADNETQEHSQLQQALDLRLRLFGLDWEPVPVIGKACKVEGWTTGPMTEERVRAETAAYPDDLSTGLRTTFRPTVDIDLEDETEVAAIVAMVEENLPPTPFKRVGRKGMAMVYLTRTPFPKIIASSSDGAKVEILGAGQQIVAYGIHPDTGKPYKWIGGTEPLDGFADPPEITRDQIYELAPKLADLLRSFGHPDVKLTGCAEPGPRRDPSPAKGGLVARKVLREQLGFFPPPKLYDDWIGWIGAIKATPIADDDDFSWRLETTQEWSAGKLDRDKRWMGDGDHPPGYIKGGRDEVRRVFESMSNDRPDAKTYGSIYREATEAGWTPPAEPLSAAFFADALGSPMNDREVAWVAAGGDLNIEFGDPFAPRAPIEFSPEWLPPNWRGIPAALGRLANVDPAPMPLITMTAAGAVSDLRRRLAVNETFKMPPRLYTMLIGDPSSAKSPALATVTEPLEALQKARDAEYAAIAAMTEDKGVKVAGEPQAKTLFLKGGTSEGVRKALVETQRGFLVTIPEFLKWYGGFDQYHGSGARSSGGSDRGFWADLYDCNPSREAFATKGIVSMPATGVGLVVLIQDKVWWRVSMEAALSDGGFLQRFIPIEQGPRPPIERHLRAEDLEQRQVYQRLMQALAGRDAPPDEGDVYPTAAAGDVLFETRETLRAIGKTRHFRDEFRHYVGKLEGLTLSVALILHMMEHAETWLEGRPLERHTAEAAREIMLNYIVPTGERYWHDEHVAGSTNSLRRFVAFGTEDTPPKGRLTKRDFTRARRRDFTGLDDRAFHAKLSFLVDDGWLIPERKAFHPFPVAYLVHPRLADAMAQFRDRELEINEARRESAQAKNAGVGEALARRGDPYTMAGDFA